MNKLFGRICEIDSNSHLSLVNVLSGNQVFTATLLEIPESAPYLKINNDVTLLFKETEVSIAKDFRGTISLSNRFPAIVNGMERGKILSCVYLQHQNNEIVSVITTASLDRLAVRNGDAVEGFIKANEIILMEGRWAE